MRKQLLLLFATGTLLLANGKINGQDVVQVTRANQQQTINLSTGQVLEIQLPKTPSNGYTWCEVTSSNEKAVQRSISQLGDGDFIHAPIPIVSDDKSSVIVGQSGTQIIRYVGTSQGTTVLTLELKRPWDKNSPAIDSYSITVVSTGKYTGKYTPPLKAIKPYDKPLTSSSSLYPSHWDWRPLCTPIENQNQCGDCWAYASVATMEANILIHDGVTRDISEEFVTDCYTANNCSGCNGGLCAHQAWLASYKGANSTGGGAVYETDDPTTCNNKGTAGTCKAPYTPHETIDSYRDIGGENSNGIPPVDSIKKAIYKYGPVWAAMDCSSSAFNSYSGGILVLSGSSTDHAICMVGWRDTTVSDNSGGYWIVKNSWGTGWGVNGSGYFYVTYGSALVGSWADYIVYKGGTPHLTVDIRNTATGLSTSQYEMCSGDNQIFYGNISNGIAPYTYSWTSLGGQVSPVTSDTMTFTALTPGTYNAILTVTDKNNFNAKDTVKIIVDSIPNLTVSYDQSICKGACVSLSAGTSFNNTELELFEGYVGGPILTSCTCSSLNANVCPSSSKSYYAIVASNSTGCSRSKKITVTVNQPPTAFNVTGGGSYCSKADGLPVGLSGSEIGVNYQLMIDSVNTGIIIQGTGSAISFGNQTNEGIYTVSATNATTACASMMIGSALIKLNPILVVTVGSDTSICNGSSVKLSAAGGTMYAWSPAATLNDANIADPFASPSTETETMYTVTVTDMNGCTAVDSVTIKVNPLPVANAGNDQAVCYGSFVTLTATGGDSYQWNNGVVQGVAFAPDSTRTYIVTATNTNGCSASDTVVITVNPLPIVNAGADQVICAGSSATLTASGGTNYYWDNNVVNGVAFTPTATNGYSVTVVDAAGCSSFGKVIITVNPIPVSQFSSSINSYKVNYTSAKDTTYLYFWDFGDGSISNQVNPTHTFTNSGYFHSCLNVTDTTSGCQSSYCKDILIGSPSTACLAKFGYSLSGNTITMIDSSLGNPDHWYWQFGDATTSTIQDPAHTFSNNGLYTISLTISNSVTNCSDNISMQVNMNNINDCISDYDFYSDVTNSTVTYTDKSTGNITNYMWNFGDDSISTLQNPVHKYLKTGNYNVCHTVYNTSTSCYNIVCKNVTVGNTTTTCKANFIFTIDSLTRTVKFSDCSYGSPDEWTWDFGDNVTSYIQNPSHVYSKDSMYLVQLTIQNDITNCSDFIDMLVNVSSTQNLNCAFGYNAQTTRYRSSSYPVDFIAAVYGNPKKYVWDFGDGKKDSSTTTPTHIYNSTGKFEVCLFVEDHTINESDLYCKQINVNNIITNTPDYLQPNVSVYPNPAINNLMIESSQPAIVEISNMQGQLIKTFTINRDKTSIDISAFSSGMYFVKATNEKGMVMVMVMMKFIKQ